MKVENVPKINKVNYGWMRRYGNKILNNIYRKTAWLWPGKPFKTIETSYERGKKNVGLIGNHLIKTYRKTKKRVKKTLPKIKIEIKKPKNQHGQQHRIGLRQNHETNNVKNLPIKRPQKLRKKPRLTQRPRVQYEEIQQQQNGIYHDADFSDFYSFNTAKETTLPTETIPTTTEKPIISTLPPKISTQKIEPGFTRKPIQKAIRNSQVPQVYSPVSNQKVKIEGFPGGKQQKPENNFDSQSSLNQFPNSNPYQEVRNNQNINNPGTSSQFGSQFYQFPDSSLSGFFKNVPSFNPRIPVEQDEPNLGFTASQTSNLDPSLPPKGGFGSEPVIPETKEVFEPVQNEVEHEQSQNARFGFPDTMPDIDEFSGFMQDFSNFKPHESNLVKNTVSDEISSAGFLNEDSLTHAYSPYIDDTFGKTKDFHNFLREQRHKRLQPQQQHHQQQNQFWRRKGLLVAPHQNGSNGYEMSKVPQTRRLRNKFTIFAPFR